MGSLLTANGIAVLRASVVFPLIGAWVAEVEADTTNASDLTGAISLAVAGGPTWKGFAGLRSGVFGGRGRALIVGGAGGLGLELAPKYYQGIPLRIPLSDILADSGETQDPSSDPATLNFQLPNWTRVRGPAGRSLGSLARAAGASWRVLASGGIWVGTETFPAFGDPFVTLAQDDTRAWAKVSTDLPTLTPGVALGGRKVGRIRHCFSPREVTSEVWFEA